MPPLELACKGGDRLIVHFPRGRTSGRIEVWSNGARTMVTIDKKRATSQILAYHTAYVSTAALFD